MRKEGYNGDPHWELALVSMLRVGRHYGVPSEWINGGESGRRGIEVGVRNIERRIVHMIN